MSAIRVAVVDDQPLLVSAFSALIAHEPDMEVVATGTDGVEAVELCATHHVDVVVMDIRMPRMDGVEATRRITSQADAPRVLVLTTFNVDDLVLGAVGAGARGFLLKDAEPSEVTAAIRAVHRGEAVIATQAAPALLSAVCRAEAAVNAAPDETSDVGPQAQGETSPVDGLTSREVDVLRLVASGLTNAEIAETLFIASTTVKTHVGNLLLKLGARDRVALVLIAHSAGLVAHSATVPLP